MATSPPTGTVTFLFTDIEGSTKLWERGTEAMSEALPRHDNRVPRASERLDNGTTRQVLRILPDLSRIHRRFIAAWFTGGRAPGSQGRARARFPKKLSLVTPFVTIGRRLGRRFKGKGGDDVMRRIIVLIIAATAVYAVARGICHFWPRLCGK